MNKKAWVKAEDSKHLCPSCGKAYSCRLNSLPTKGADTLLLLPDRCWFVLSRAQPLRGYEMGSEESSGMSLMSFNQNLRGYGWGLKV